MQMLAEPAVQLFGRQTATYRGGWPQGFISGTCSGDAPVKCQPNSMYPLNCCPSGQICSDDWPVHCCPDDGADCSVVALKLPVCANSAWNMYKLQRTGWFCCPKDMVGIITPDEWTGICQEKSANIPTTMLATIVAQFGASPVTSAGNSPTDALQPGIGGGSQDTTSVGAGGGGSNNPGNAGGGDSSNDGSSGGTIATAGSNGGSSSSPGGSGGGGGMSAGSIAGIVIGSIAFFGLVAALILWMHRRSLRKNPPSGMAAGQHLHNPSKPVGTMHHGGDAPEVVQYGSHPVAASPMVYSPHQTVSPQESAPAYSPTHGISEVNGVPRAEMDVPRSSNYY